jgi:hypothetical protein
MGATLSALEESGLVEPSSDPNDGRASSDRLLRALYHRYRPPPAPHALEIRQREPAGAEYGEVNESAGYRDVADESVSDHRANFRWSLNDQNLTKTSETNAVNSASAPAATRAYPPKTSATPPAPSKTPVTTKKNAGTGRCSDATWVFRLSQRSGRRRDRPGR